MYKFILPLLASTAFAMPAVVERDFAPGTCKVSISSDAYYNEADTAQPYWVASNVFDGSGAKTADFGWSHCPVVDGHQRCEFWSGLKDEILLDPIKDGQANYVQVHIGGSIFTTKDGNCQVKRNEPDSSAQHMIWECTFACW